MLTEKKKNQEKFKKFFNSLLHDISPLTTSDVEEIRYYLSHGVDVNWAMPDRDDGVTHNRHTPLFLAISHERTDIAQLFLDEGADPNRANGYGQTPLYRATCIGHKDVVQLLLERGASPNKPIKFGRTPLHYSAQNDNKDVVQLLLDRGADPNNEDISGYTPLHEAARNGHKDVVKLLLHRGADSNYEDEDGVTPLHEAARFNRAAKIGYRNMIQVLLDNGADPNKDCLGRTSRNYLEKCKSLILVKLRCKVVGGGICGHGPGSGMKCKMEWHWKIYEKLPKRGRSGEGKKGLRI